MEPLIIILIASICYILLPLPIGLWSILRVPKRTKSKKFEEMVTLSSFSDFHSSTRHNSNADLEQVDLSNKPEEDKGLKIMEIPIHNE